MPFARTSGASTRRIAGLLSPTTLTFVGMTSSTTATVSFHASAAAGDLAIVFEHASGGTLTNNGLPSGWSDFSDGGADTSAFFNSTNDQSFQIYYKILTAGDITTGSVTGVNSGSSLNIYACHIYRPDNPINTVTAFNTEGVFQADPPSNTMAASGQPTPSIVFALGVDLGGVPFDTESPTFTNAQDLDSGNVRCGSTRYNSSPADHTVDNGSNAGSEGLVSGGCYVT